MKDNRHDETLLESAKSDLEAIESATSSRSKLRLVKMTVLKIRSDIKAGGTQHCTKGCGSINCPQPLYGVTAI